MVIFHSYVSLPEGNDLECFITPHDTFDTFGRYIHHKPSNLPSKLAPT